MNLYEPGILLIFKSVDKYPQLTERLIEYLYSYVYLQDETRVAEYSLSVQKVLLASERLRIIPPGPGGGGVGGKVTDLINNPRLSQGIQAKLKKLYTADIIIQ